MNTLEELEAAWKLELAAIDDALMKRNGSDANNLLRHHIRSGTNRSGEVVCNVIAAWVKALNGAVVDPKALWESSPNGDLLMVYELYNKARAWLGFNDFPDESANAILALIQNTDANR